MDFGRRRENGNGYSYGYGNGIGNGVSYDRINFEDKEFGDGPIAVPSSSKVFPISASSSTTSSCSSSSSPLRYIEHHVSKMDTLAGIAIRYGVEVADIKKMNGLVTDLQMFALKTLHIPLPGRHPPSPSLSNGHSTAGPSSSEQPPSRRVHTDLLESFQSLKITPERKVSPAMSSLRGYYGLNGHRNSSEECEMTLYSRGTTSYGEEQFSTQSSLMNPPLNQHRRSRSVANGFKTEEEELANDMEDAAKWIDKLNMRCQKPEVDYGRTPEKLLKEENGSGGWFSAITGKGLALRTKAASRNNLSSDAEAGAINGFPLNLGDSTATESSSGVRKSSSTPSFQDQDSSNSSSSIWSATKWSLKPDIQAALTKPIFDGLPKPITGRKSKTALD
ncbi:LysM and putative peptidoglycan-binding domain-containing protein 1 [Bienertia sinuspersici]